MVFEHSVSLSEHDGQHQQEIVGDMALEWSVYELCIEYYTMNQPINYNNDNYNNYHLLKNKIGNCRRIINYSQ